MSATISAASHHGRSSDRSPQLSDVLAKMERDFRDAHPRSAALYEEALRVMPGGNTRTVLHYGPFPITIERGEDSRLTCVDGFTYVDFLGEYSACLYGHSDPVVARAAVEAIARGTALGGPNAYEAPLAGALRDRFPSCELIRFCNTGTEANLLAVSLAVAVTGRPRLAGFSGAYHGSLLKVAEPPPPIRAPFPVAACPYNDLGGVEAELASGNVAAVIVEPMMGSAGAIPAEPTFLRGLRELCDASGALLIFDEVVTSRLTGGGLQAHYGVRPDLTTFGKYIGGGFSFGAIGGRADILDRFDPRRPNAFAHAGTFNNNSVSMAAGFAGLTQVFTRARADRHFAEGEAFRGQLNGLCATSGRAIRFTGLGSILNVHFTAAPVRSAADVRPDPELRRTFHLFMLERGFYAAPRGYVTVSLPITDQDKEGFVDAVGEFVSTMADHLCPASA